MNLEQLQQIALEDPSHYSGEYGKAMAELPMEVKNRISHRGQALRALVSYLRGID